MAYLVEKPSINIPRPPWHPPRPPRNPWDKAINGQFPYNALGETPQLIYDTNSGKWTALGSYQTNNGVGSLSSWLKGITWKSALPYLAVAAGTVALATIPLTKETKTPIYEQAPDGTAIFKGYSYTGGTTGLQFLWTAVSNVGKLVMKGGKWLFSDNKGTTQELTKEQATSQFPDAVANILKTYAAATPEQQAAINDASNMDKLKRELHPHWYDWFENHRTETTVIGITVAVLALSSALLMGKKKHVAAA